MGRLKPGAKKLYPSSWRKNRRLAQKRRYIGNIYLLNLLFVVIQVDTKATGGFILKDRKKSYIPIDRGNINLKFLRLKEKTTDSHCEEEVSQRQDTKSFVKFETSTFCSTSYGHDHDYYRTISTDCRNTQEVTEEKRGEETVESDCKESTSQRQNTESLVQSEIFRVCPTTCGHDHDYFQTVSMENKHEVIEENTISRYTMDNNNKVLCQDTTDNDNDYIIDRILPGASQSAKTSDKIVLEGRRIVDITHIFNEIAKIGQHPLFDCSFADMYPIRENRMGLQNLITFKCKMCNMEKRISLCETSDLNKGLVLGAISSGLGYAGSETIMACLNIPFMTSKTYINHEEALSEVIHNVAWKTIEDAGKEEADIAKNFGEVDNNGVPLITVVADGAWSKRSYSLNYNAPSGVACIIGARTRKILFLGVRNKYCCICSRAESKQLNIPQHQCYKNWTSTSTSMESDIIVEGFKKSVELHGVIFKKLVGDGDSSVYNKLLENKPYENVHIEKIECRNHLLRNFSKKIREICGRKRSNSKKVVVVPMLRKIVEKNAMRLRTGIKYAVLHHIQEETDISEKVQSLKKDLSNVASHVFGEHKLCSELQYFNCTKKGMEKNYVPEMTECGLFADIEVCFNRLIYHAPSLIINMDTNIAEQYNSIVCKFVGGKRVNYAQRRSYTTRCEAAAISFNTKGDYFLSLMDQFKETPTYTRKYVEKMKRIRELNAKRPVRRKVKTVALPDKDYGIEGPCESEFLPNNTK